MGRKTTGILTVLLLFGLVAGWYYFTSESKYFNTPAFKAVPSNTAVIIRIQNISAFSAKTSNNFLLKEFSSFTGISSIAEDLHFVDSLMQKDPASQKYLSNKNITLSYGERQGKKSLLYLVELSDMAEKTALKNLIRDYFSKRKASSFIRKEGEITATVYYWSNGPNRTTFCISFYKGVFISGSDPDQVIDASKQLDQPSIAENPEFQKISKTASPNADLNIYFNRRNIGSTVSALFSNNFLKRINAGAPNKFWAEIDCNLKENELLFNGFTLPSDSLNDYMGVLLHQKPSAFILDRYFPSETSFFLSLNFQDIPSYFRDYEEMLSKKGELDAYKKSLAEADTLYGSNLQNIIKENCTGQAGIVFTRDDVTEPLENKFLVIKIKNEKLLDSLMLRLVKPVIPGKRSIFRGQSQDFKMGKDTLFKIYQIPVTNFGERVFGKIFQDVPTSFFTICDSCLIMGGSFKALEEYLRSLVLHETLDKNSLYKEFTMNFSQLASLCTWGIPADCLPFFSSDLNPGIVRELKDQDIKLHKINSFGWQMGNDKGMIYNVGLVSYSTVSFNRPLAIWRFHPDSTINLKPFLVNNQEKTNKPDVLVQDIINNLYLISNNGQLKWKKKLSGPVLSEIYQVNYHKDTRIQYLFNTPNALHMIDAEGNYIPGFPVKLKSKATNGIGVFDYDRTRDYRIFVACEDKNIYAFDRNGIAITGWQAAPAEDLVTNPVQFFRVMGKDYIVFADRKKIHILDRKGNPRVILQQEISPSQNNGFTLENATARTQARLVTTDQQGTIRFINFEGSISKLSVGKFTDQHYFLDSDIDRDGQMEYLILDSNSLFVYNVEGGVIFTKKYSGKIDSAPEIFDLEDRGIKIGIVDRTSNQIYLYNADGSDYPGFPIEANTPFNIGILNPGNNRFNILAGSTDGFLNNFSLK